MSNATRRRTKPGSRADLIFQIIAERSRSLGRGIELAEIREAYEAATGRPAPESLTSEVHSMKRRGVIEVVGGRPGHTLFAPPGSHFKGTQNPDDDALLVLRAVKSGYRRLGRALSTREVEAEINRLGLNLSYRNANTIRKHLETLARFRRRGPRAFRRPKVVRVTGTTVSGRPSAHWAPASAVDDDGAVNTAPRSAADAVRRTIESAASDLKRPVSARELRWWMRLPWASDVHGGLLDERRIGRIVADTAKSDRKYRGDAGRIHEVRHDWTCYGGPPVRYCLGPPSDFDLAICAFEDMLEVLRPADELRSIEGLRARARATDSWVLNTLAEIRYHTLCDLFSNAIYGFPPKAFVERAARVHSALAGWYNHSSTGLSDDQREERRATFNRWAAQFHAGVRLLLSEVPAEPRAIPVGFEGIVAYEDLVPLLRKATEWLGTSGDRAERQLVAGARRLANHLKQGAKRLGLAADGPLSYLDRVDALTAIWELFPVPRASMLIQAGAEALGFVVRDASRIRRLLGMADGSDGTVRRTLVVALGLLGEQVDVHLAIPDRSDPDDTAAWVLATVLADWDRAAEQVREADRTALGPARRITDTALMRLEAGAVFSVVG